MQGLAGPVGPEGGTGLRRERPERGRCPFAEVLVIDGGRPEGEASLVRGHSPGVDRQVGDQLDGLALWRLVLPGDLDGTEEPDVDDRLDRLLGVRSVVGAGLVGSVRFGVGALESADGPSQPSGGLSGRSSGIGAVGPPGGCGREQLDQIERRSWNRSARVTLRPRG